MLLTRSVCKCMYHNMVLLNMVLMFGVVYTCECEWHMSHVALVTQLLYWLLQLVTFVGYQRVQVLVT